jgi:hypothetical protein
VIRAPIAVRTTIVALAALLLILSGTAGAVASLVFSTPFLSTGPAQLSGTPTVLDVRLPQIVSGISLEVETLNLHMETDSAEYVNTGPSAIGTRPVQTTTQDFGAAIIRASPTQTSSGLFLVPLTGEFSAGMQGVAASVPGTACQLQPTFFERPRDPLCPDLASAVYLAGELDRPLIVTGHFQIFLYGWEGEISSAGQVEEFWSGVRYSLPQAGVALGQSEFRGVSFDGVGNLSLTIPKMPVTLAASSTQLTGQEISLANGQATAPVGSALVTRASNDVAVSFTSGRVTLADGTTVTVGQAGASSLWVWTLLAIGAVVAAPPAVLGGRRFAASRHLQHARDNIALENFHSAARHAEAAMASRAHAVPAGVIGAIALIRADDLEDARFFLDSLRNNPSASPAAVLYLEACVEAKAGNAAAARGKLVTCFAIAPAYEAEARVNPILEGVLP